MRNTVSLPDGRVTVQVIKRACPGGDVSFLEIDGEELNLIRQDIPISSHLGYLLGVDREGRLKRDSAAACTPALRSRRSRG